MVKKGAVVESGFEPIQFRTTKVFKDIESAFDKGYRRVLLEGGQGSSKTYSVLQFLIHLAKNAPEPILISIVSESMPHLKKGAMRDFFKILHETAENNPYFNKTDSIYSRWKGRIEFFGADDAAKARGPRREVLFLNEANNINRDVAIGLDARTSVLTLADWNPVSEFWAHELWKPLDTSFYSHSTYLDSMGLLPQSEVETIESYRERDPNWWRIYGLGLVGKIEGLVYPFFEQVDKLPDGDVVYGLDFGFSNDPAVLTANVVVGDCLYSKELIYETGLTNDALARKMDLIGVERSHSVIYADSAEPKSIQELVDRHFIVKPAEKGKGSVDYGIQKVNQYKQFWTKDSTNCIKEQRNFMFIKDRDGKITDRTTHQWSHGMDSRRYCVSSHRFSSRLGARQAILGSPVVGTQTILGDSRTNPYAFAR